MRFQRVIDLSLIHQKSIFLFGPRQTGKSFLLRHRFPDFPYYNLLESDLFLKLSKQPALLREELLALKPQTPIIIDEIQRIPILLNEVHLMIEEHGFKFILTGSIARKLKRGGANMLAGRALEFRLFPLSTHEIPNFDFNRIINFGALPAIYNSSIPREELIAYVGTYLQEEIKAEGLVRNLEPFADFLDLSGISNTELINYANIASDLGVSSKTVKEYYQILQDTMLGYLLKPYTKTVKRKAVSTPKFYYFDLGVANLLGNISNIVPKSEIFGKVFEHFIFTEIKAYLHYKRDSRKLTFWRSKNKQEVDFIIGDDIALEVKASSMVKQKHLKGLNALSEENISFQHKLVVSMDDRPRKMENKILILPYSNFLKKLWNNEFC